MSIKPWDKYQPNALLPSVQYPYGALKQETATGAGNGTPLDVDWGNDFEAFKQTAFSRSGLIPSGNADTVTNSEMFNAMQDIISRNIWKTIVSESGYNLVDGSFEEGGTVLSVDDYLWYKSENKLFRWGGGLSSGKTVPPSSTPTSSGGISQFGWVQLETAGLLNDLSSSTGYQKIGDSIIARLSTLKAKFGVAAWAQAANYKTFHIDINDTKSSTYSIPAGQTVILDGEVTHSASSACFMAQSVSGWSLTGNGRLNGGSLPTSLDAPHTGLLVVDCFGFSIAGSIEIVNFRGNGAYFDGTSEVSGPVSFSHVSGMRLHDNWINHTLSNGFAAEYTTFTGCWNFDAVSIAMVAQTGNINYIGGGVTHSRGVGLYLQHPTLGGNPHHGMFVGTMFNHNAGASVLAEGVANGMQFIGCNFYHGGATDRGYIFLNSSRGISFVGGILACDVYCRESDGDPHLGWNSIKGMFVLEDTVGGVPASGRIISGVTSLGTMSRRKFISEGNFTNAGPWRFNDVGGNGVYANYRPAANIRITSAAQTVKFTSKMRDDRDSYNTNIGHFTAPFWGIARVRVDLHLLTNSNTQTAGHNLLFFRDDTGTGNSYTQYGKQKVVAGNGNTTASAFAVWEIPVSAGARLVVQYQAPDYATQLCDIDANNSSISFEMI